MPGLRRDSPGYARATPSVEKRTRRGGRLSRCRARLAALVPACLLAGLPAWAAAAGTAARVVTLAPHITEMVFAAGAGHTLAGTVVSSNYPDAARALPKVGDGAASVNAEALVRLKPDLVLAWHDSGAAAAVAPLLQSLGVPLEFLAPARLDDIPDQIEGLGKRLGTQEKAQRAASALRDELRELRRRYADRPPVSVFIEIGHSPLYAVGKDALLNDALHTCGGTNVFGDSAFAALPIGAEHIVQKHPDVILAAAATPQQERQAKDRWAALGLANPTHTQVYGIDPDTLFRPGPRLIDATRDLCRKLEDARKKTRH
ncbi:helical backbone metal receptor [Pusillimonas sp.]|uniref:helical backbone metal receptor n=1 Tax=Pusillimonas sp. TaxID=3040095 RepID=UPI0029B596D2|nr:helical backbone metal receptor [Pusillimonas sp.]MDX3894760.1 helical backbone metal receptor [Pusillimonas sp.]